MADSFLDIQNILGIYSKEVDDALYEVCKEVGKDAVNLVKSKSPVNEKNTQHKGRYRRGWTMDLQKGFGVVEATIHNRTDYQLTHLLEREHVGKNQYGVWGTVHPKSEGHISDAEKIAVAQYEKEVEARLKEIGG